MRQKKRAKRLPSSAPPAALIADVPVRISLLDGTLPLVSYTEVVDIALSGESAEGRENQERLRHLTASAGLTQEQALLTIARETIQKEAARLFHLVPLAVQTPSGVHLPQSLLQVTPNGEVTYRAAGKQARKGG